MGDINLTIPTITLNINHLLYFRKKYKTLIKEIKESQKFKCFIDSWQTLMTFSSLFGSYCSVAQSCLTLCNPMDCRTPGFLVHRQLPELAQTHIYQASDAIQPSHPLLSPSPPAFNRCYFIQIMLLYLYIISIFPNLRQCFR